MDYWADPEAVAAVLPPGLEPDPDDSGRCGAFFADWQYASAGGDKPLDPVRSQYHEFILLVNGPTAESRSARVRTSTSGRCRSNHRRLAEAVATLGAVAADPLLLGERPVVTVRHFLRLSAGLHNKPAVHTTTRQDQELAMLRPVRVGRGFRSMPRSLT